MAHKKKIVSLFSGALGLDIGIKDAGFELLSIVECDKYAVETAKKNLDRLNKNLNINIIQERMSLNNIDDICAKILGDNNLSAGNIDVLAGAPPCQPFSTAGKRQSIMDARGDGFDVFFRAIEILKPKYFVIENVKGILSAAIKHRPLLKRGAGFPPLQPEEEHGSAFYKILDDLKSISEENGYCISWGVLNSADFGSPQSRERLIIIGSIDGQFIWPKATHDRYGRNGLFRWATLKQALSGLNEKDLVYKAFSEKNIKYLSLIPEGSNWKSLPPSLQEEALGGAYNSWGGRSGFLRRLSWDKPAPTITQSPQSKATMLCHPEETRPLTVRECARIQGFPDEWEFVGSITTQYKQIGNATPIALAKAIGNEISNAYRRKKGAHNCMMYCADEELLKRMIKMPSTTLSPPGFRKEKCAHKTKNWLSRHNSKRSKFSKYISFGA